MTTAAPGNLEATFNDSNQKKPGASKKEKGKGRAVPGAGNSFTPEPSLGPDPARNAADRTKKQTDGSISTVENITPSIEGQDDPHEPSTTRSQPPEHEDDQDNDGEQLRAAAIQNVLNCKSDDYHGIWGIEENYDDHMLELTAIETAVYNRGTDLHPKFNQSEGAGQAFKMVCDAGRALGCREEVLEEVNNWEGEGEKILV